MTAYDKNGNIRNLQRYGQTVAATYGMIDNLTFTLNGNRLSRVDDAATASAYGNGFEFKDGAKQADEYAYDANGNLTKDLNKNIADIRYNFLNLPICFSFNTGGFLQHGYTADGVRRRTIYKELDGPTSPVTTVYCGNVIYENNVPRLLLHEEGYVTLDDNSYHYYVKDHQGNNCLVVDSSGAVEEANHYYPFGGVFASTGNVQPYKYNGKELDTEKGLDWYDYGARMYDPALGRFTTIDPSSENYYSTSLFAYCGADPVNRIDPTGTDWYRDSDGNYHWVPDGGDKGEWTWVGQTISVQLSEDSFINYYENGGIKTNMPVDAFDLIAAHPRLQNLFLGKNSVLSEADKSKLFNGIVSRENDKIGRPVGEFLVESGAAALTGAALDKLTGWAAKGVAGLLGKGGNRVTLWPAASVDNTVLNGIEYTKHALERMQPVGTVFKGTELGSRGIPPSVVEHAIKYGKVTPGKTANEVVRTFENVRVVTNPQGNRVITVIKIGH